MNVQNIVQCGLSIAITCGATGSAYAESSSDWRGMIGAGAIYAPKYEGADESETSGFPLLELSWRDTLFFGPEGLGVNLINRNDLRIFLALGYDEGRKESDSADLAGLGDVDGGATLSFGVEYEWGPLVPYMQVIKYFEGTEGVTAEFGVQGFMPLRAITGSADMGSIPEDASPMDLGPLLTAGVSATWANDDYTQGLFGVSSAQAGTSGLAHYDAGSGIKSVDLRIGAIVPLSDHWSLNGFASYSKLVGDAADSPIVKDEDQFAVGMFVGFQF